MTPEELLATIHAAFLAGDEHGYARGRHDERTRIGWERLQARAGTVVSRLASVPEVDPFEQARVRSARQASVRRLMRHQPGWLPRKRTPSTTTGKRVAAHRRGAA